MSTTTQLPDYLEILLAGLANHPIVGPAIAGAQAGGPVGSMFAAIHEGDRWFMLSTGEQIILTLALSLWNGNLEAKVADLGRLDDQNRHRACTAVIARFCPLWGQED